MSGWEVEYGDKKITGKSKIHGVESNVKHLVVSMGILLICIN